MRSTSGNPMIRGNIFSKPVFDEKQMTVRGTYNKTLLLIVIAVLAAALTWTTSLRSVTQDGYFSFTYLMVASLGGFVLAIATTFKPQIANITSPLYAICEGVFLGAVTLFAELNYPGIAFKAVVGTFTVFFIMLYLYRSGRIRVTSRLRSTVMVATAGVCLTYFIFFILRLVGVNMTALDFSPLGIGLSLLVVGIASFNLLLDFDFIDRAAAGNAPGHLEWYAAFSLVVTLVWVYLEILRLLIRVAGRRD